jgi:cob(I)alamin adenosyltransferase
MKIYTKTGDGGETGLPGGRRLPKDDSLIRVIGDVDELNAFLGVCAAHNRHARIGEMLRELQRELFDLGAGLAAKPDSGLEGERVPGALTAAKAGKFEPAGKRLVLCRRPDATAAQIERLEAKAGLKVARMEQWIDEIDGQLEPLRNFILPEGSALAAHFHVARAVCRRAERSAVGLQKNGTTGMAGPDAVKYLNRLGDLLFMLARLANKLEGVEEELWSRE